MKRNQRGVTLISLVVTIVVMLIIAGAAISTLGGENGIITQSQNSRVQSTQADVVEKMQLIATAINQKVMMKTSSDFSYRPKDHISDFIADVQADLADVKVISGATNPATEIQDGYNVFIKDDSIYMVYKDNTFALAVPTAATGYPVETTSATTTFPIDKQYAMLVGQIVFQTNSVSYIAPISTAK